MPIPALSFVSKDLIEVEGGGSVSERTYTQTWRVVTNDHRYGPTSICAHSSWPTYGSIYTFNVPGEDVTGWDLGAVLLRKRAKLENKDASKVRWLVTLEYGKQNDQDQPSPETPGEIAEHPLQQRPKVTFSFVDYLVAVESDKDGKAIESSSKEPFDPPVEDPLSMIEIRVTKNYGSIDLAALEAMRGKRNNAAIFGGKVATGKGRLMGVEGEQSWHANSPYYPLTLTFHVRDDWMVKKLDQGFFEWYEMFAGDGEKQHRILDKDGSPRQSPALLDGNGRLLPRTGSPPPAPVYREFLLSTTVDMSSLELPDLPNFTPPTYP